MQARILEKANSIQNLVFKVDAFPVAKIEKLVLDLEKTFKDGGKIAFLGNGGSAAEAMHLAAEFTGKCVVDHEPLPALCLNESQSSITAVGNDFGFEHVFSRMVKAFLKPNDILIALSTSGKSLNVINAIESANQIGVQCHLWTGEFVPELENTEIWTVPSNETPRIQEVHLMWGHILAEIFEERLARRRASK
jgi:D-sedoheptulose 7-phosphate isomerase